MSFVMPGQKTDESALASILSVPWCAEWSVEKFAPVVGDVQGVMNAEEEVTKEKCFERDEQ